jgi:hypothetical protein
VVSCSDGGCMCFRQRPGRDIGSESVLNGDETEECLQFPVVAPSSAQDAMPCVSRFLQLFNMPTISRASVD